MIVFYDSSALLKRYIEESGSNWLADRMDSDEDIHAISAITHTELACVLARRLKNPSATLKQLRIDISHLQQVSVDEQVIALSVKLGIHHRLRGCDALQLACAVALHKAAPQLVMTFVCADDQLNLAAHAEKLVVENPNSYP